MPRPLVSVIIPVFNHRRALKRSLGSLVAQAYRPLEVIIVNDGSTDGVEADREEVKNLLNAAGLLCVWITCTNRGAAVARTTGFEASKGEYVLFWDADTLAPPAFIARYVEALEKNPRASYAYADYQYGWKAMPSRPFDATMLKRCNYIDMTSLIRRADFPGFDENLRRFQDWDLWLTLLSMGKTGIYVPGSRYRKIVGLRSGISSWFPSWFIRHALPFSGIKKYHAAREKIFTKHAALLRS